MRFSRSGMLSLALTLPLAAALPGCIVVVHEDHDDSYTSMSGSKRIGVETGELGEALASQAGVERHRASVITRVLAGSPAEAAGLQRWDVIKLVEGQSDGSYWSLRHAVEAKNVGDPIQITIVRAGKDLQVAPIVGAR